MPSSHALDRLEALGTFLRAFTFGHVRQLDRVAEAALTRAWALGAGPGGALGIIDLDSTVCEVRHAKQGAACGYTRVLGDHPLLATQADTGELLHVRMRKGSANTARGAERFVNELVGRIRRAGAAGPLTLPADSGLWSAKVVAACRRHAVVELAIGDLKDGAGLRHCPSGRLVDLTCAITRLRALPAAT